MQQLLSFFILFLEQTYLNVLAKEKKEYVFRYCG